MALINRRDTAAFRRRRFPHLQRMRVRLSDGSTAQYVYHRLAKRRLYSEYGTPAFEAEYEAAHRGSASPAKPPEPTYVYFIRAVATGHIKIGKARSPASRLKELQVGCPDDLEIVGMVCDPAGGPLEIACHAHFARHRIRGEWFRGEPDLMAWIAEHAHSTPAKARKAAASGLTEKYYPNEFNGISQAG